MSRIYRCRRCAVVLGLLPHVYCRDCIEELFELAAAERPTRTRKDH